MSLFESIAIYNTCWLCSIFLPEGPKGCCKHLVEQQSLDQWLFQSSCYQTEAWQLLSAWRWKTMESLMLRPAAVSCAFWKYIFAIYFPGFHISDTSAERAFLKIKVFINHRRMAEVYHEPEIRHLPMGSKFTTGCLFTWDILVRKDWSWSMHPDETASPCWGGLVSTTKTLIFYMTYQVTLIFILESLVEVLLS